MEGLGLKIYVSQQRVSTKTEVDVNDVKISGFLGEVQQHVSKDAVRIATGRLKFNWRCDTLPLLAIDARVQQLTQYKPGDSVRVTGRLVIHPDTKKFAILVDVVTSWKTPPGRVPHDPDVDETTLRGLE
jgi:hypothetical protein